MIIQSNGNARNDGSDAITVHTPTMPSPGIAQILWRRRWTLLAVMSLFLIGGIGYVATVPPIYSSSARLCVQRNTTGVLGSEATAIGASHIPTQCELLKSNAILGPVLELPDVRRMQMFADDPNPLASLQKALDISVARNSDVITLTLESPYPQDAAVVLSRIVESYMNYRAREATAGSTQALAILQKEKAKQETEFHTKLNQLIALRQRSDATAAHGKDASVVLEKLNKFSEALTAARLDLMDARADYETAKALASDPTKTRQVLLDMAGNRSLSALLEAMGETGAQQTATLQRLEQLRQEMAAARQRYLPNHKVIQSLQGQIDELTLRLASSATDGSGASKPLVDMYLLALQRQITKASRRVDQIQLTLDEEKQRVAQASADAWTYELLDADLAQIQKFRGELDSRIKQLTAVQGQTTADAEVVEAPRPAATPVRPTPNDVFLRTLLMGVIAGIFLALAREWTDQRIHSVDEAYALLGVPLLGTVPRIRGRRNGPQRGQIVQVDPKSDVAEAYRGVRTAVNFGLPTRGARSLLITSATPGEGKTMTASNLSIAMAQAGHRVLLVDADLRQPMQHMVFRIKDAVGISNVLAGRATIDHAVCHTPIDNLDVLPCGPIPSNPSEILNSNNFADLLNDLSARYDYILVDSPPVNAVSDARILSATCDATIMVLRAEKSTRRATRHAHAILNGMGASICGLIVNDISRDRNRYDYYGYQPRNTAQPAGGTFAVNAAKDSQSPAVEKRAA